MLNDPILLKLIAFIQLKTHKNALIVMMVCTLTEDAHR
jgi:hypothetical protein